MHSRYFDFLFLLLFEKLSSLEETNSPYKPDKGCWFGDADKLSSSGE